MMVERLKLQGTSHSSRDLLNICVKIGASWSALSVRTVCVFLTGYYLSLCFTVWPLILLGSR